jgi:hypothetical protein
VARRGLAGQLSPGSLHRTHDDEEWGADRFGEVVLPEPSRRVAKYYALHHSQVRSLSKQKLLLPLQDESLPKELCNYHRTPRCEVGAPAEVLCVKPVSVAGSCTGCVDSSTRGNFSR